MILKQADNLSETLQNATILAAQGQGFDQDLVETFLKFECDKQFELFWCNLLMKKTELDVADGKLSRKRKLPDFFHQLNSNSLSFYHDLSKDFYRQLYFETLGNVINCIKNCFSPR